MDVWNLYYLSKDNNVIIETVSVKKSIILLSVLIVSGFGFQSAFAHTTIHIEQYEIEAGWGDEPQFVGLPKTVVLEIR